MCVGVTDQVSQDIKNAVHLVNLAVSNVSGGSIEFHAGGTSGDYAGTPIERAFELNQAAQQNAQIIPVETTTLDDYLLRALPDLALTTSSMMSNSEHELYLVKIDTQGFDGVVLEGMQQLLKQKKVRPEPLVM